MIIFLRKRTLAGAGMLTALFLCLSCILAWGIAPPSVSSFAPGENPPSVVVIDPGHGGEDGGAVSADGAEESRINLDIALCLNQMLRFSGKRTLMTRSDASSISDPGLSTIRERKVSDLKNRVKLVNDTENAVLLSIHQNSLPSSPVTHGAQVFWNQQPGAEVLAKGIQNALNARINTERPKEPKEIPSSIYLMKHVQSPAVLVECGFLANESEAAKLQETPYQKKLAAVIAAGYLECLTGEKEP